MKPPSRRLFFALWPAPEEQVALGRATQEAMRDIGGRAVPVSNLHLTLAFLGSVPEPRLDEAMAVAQQVSESGVVAPSLSVSFEQAQYWKKANVLCAVPAESRGDDFLAAAGSLAAALKTALLAAGFSPDLKPFRAHVTLARKVSCGSDWRPGLRMHPVTWRLTHFSLLESRTDARGALYSVVESWLLAKPHID